MGYVLGMFMVICMIAVALGVIFAIYGDPKVREKH